MIFLLPTKRLIHNNTQINYIRKKSRNSWEASAPWASVKSATPKLVSKFETQSHYRTSSLMVQHHTIKRNHPAPSFSLGREIKSWAIMSNVPTYLRAVWGTDWLLSHLCWSTNRAWYILEVWGPIRAKMMVWISTQALITTQHTSNGLKPQCLASPHQEKEFDSASNLFISLSVSWWNSFCLAWYNMVKVTSIL